MIQLLAVSEPACLPIHNVYINYKYIVCLVLYKLCRTQSDTIEISETFCGVFYFVFLHLHPCLGIETNVRVQKGVYCGRDCQPDVCRCPEIYGHHDLHKYHLVGSAPDSAIADFLVAGPWPECACRARCHDFAYSIEYLCRQQNQKAAGK